MVWTFDSSVLWQEPFVIYSQMLGRTSNVKVGPMVTNPLSRELSVTASLFATLNDMFGNRTICGIGRGDSAMRVPRPGPVVTGHTRPRHQRDQGPGRGPGGRLRRYEGPHPVGAGRPAGGVDGGLRAEGAEGVR